MFIEQNQPVQNFIYTTDMTPTPMHIHTQKDKPSNLALAISSYYKHIQQLKLLIFLCAYF